MENELAVGSTVWVFDINRRVYKKDASGHSIGRPIYREHFKTILITGETSRSWILANGIKINKNTLEGIYTSTKQIEQAVWVHDNRYRISQDVGRCNDYNILTQIAELLRVKK